MRKGSVALITLCFIKSLSAGELSSLSSSRPSCRHHLLQSKAWSPLPAPCLQQTDPKPYWETRKILSEEHYQAEVFSQIVDYVLETVSLQDSIGLTHVNRKFRSYVNDHFKKKLETHNSNPFYRRGQGGRQVFSSLPGFYPQIVIVDSWVARIKGFLSNPHHETTLRPPLRREAQHYLNNLTQAAALGSLYSQYQVLALSYQRKKAARQGLPCTMRGLIFNLNHPGAHIKCVSHTTIIKKYVDRLEGFFIQMEDPLHLLKLYLFAAHTDLMSRLKAGAWGQEDAPSYLSKANRCLLRQQNKGPLPPALAYQAYWLSLWEADRLPDKPLFRDRRSATLKKALAFLKEARDGGFVKAEVMLASAAIHKKLPFNFYLSEAQVGSFAHGIQQLRMLQEKGSLAATYMLGKTYLNERSFLMIWNDLEDRWRQQGDASHPGEEVCDPLTAQERESQGILLLQQAASQGHQDALAELLSHSPRSQPPRLRRQNKRKKKTTRARGLADASFPTAGTSGSLALGA